MKRQLIIIGGGALGREVLHYANDLLATNDAKLDFSSFAGFLDDAPDAKQQLAKLGVESGFVEPIQQHLVDKKYAYVLAVGKAKLRNELLSNLSGQPFWANIVHPTAYVASSATLGKGVVLAPFTFVGANAKIADHVVLNPYASVGHDSRIGNRCVLSPYATVNGNVQLGEEVFMGTHTTVIPGKKVGQGSTLSAGTVVFRDVPENYFMIGNPGKGWRKPPA